MSLPILHYIYDPLCGWCYGASPLIQAAKRVNGLTIALHGGGMMTGANRQQVTPALRSYVMPHDHRIASLTGQPFGEPYFKGLLMDTEAVFDSAPPTIAVLAAAQWGTNMALDMLARIQHAHYAQGRQIAREETLYDLARELALPEQEFVAAYQAHSGKLIHDHIQHSRQFLAEQGGQGFPTFILQQQEHYSVVDITAYWGKPDEFAHALAHYVLEVNENSLDSTVEQASEGCQLGQCQR